MFIILKKMADQRTKPEEAKMPIWNDEKFEIQVKKSPEPRAQFPSGPRGLSRVPGPAAEEAHGDLGLAHNIC
jgi:hypothetical protein